MTGDIVNLRQARKRKGRAEAAVSADQNRLEHGRSKAERTRSKGGRALEDRLHAAHRREPPKP